MAETEDLTVTPRDEMRRAVEALRAAADTVPDSGSAYGKLISESGDSSVLPEELLSHYIQALQNCASAFDALAGLPRAVQYPHLRSAIEAGVALAYLTEDASDLYPAFLVLLDADWRQQRSAKHSPFGDIYERVTGEPIPQRYWAHSIQLRVWERTPDRSRIATELAGVWQLLSAHQHGSMLARRDGEEVHEGIVQGEVDLAFAFWHLSELIAVCARQIEASKTA